MEAPVVFVSDVHIHHGEEELRDRFCEFLRSRSGVARTVIIHGDLFDFYVGPRQGRLPFYRPLFDALGELVAAGVMVAVVPGNRDFLMGRCFLQRGVRILPDGTTLELGGLRVHLSHGDGFCIHDRSYLFWARGVLRSVPVRILVRSLPVGLAIWLARRYRRVSHRKHQRFVRKETGRLETILDGVRQLLEEDFHDVVICGHIHQLRETPMEVVGGRARLLTTAAWQEKPNHILFDGAEFHLRESAS